MSKKLNKELESILNKCIEEIPMNKGKIIFYKGIIEEIFLELLKESK